MISSFPALSPAEHVFSSVEAYIQSQGYTIVDKDHSRPWGGFFVIQEDQAGKFAQQFFPQLSLDSIQITNKLHLTIILRFPKKAI